MEMRVYINGNLQHVCHGEIGDPVSFYYLERYGPVDSNTNTLTARRFAYLNSRIDALERAQPTLTR